LSLGALSLAAFLCWDRVIAGVDTLAPSLSAVPLVQTVEALNGPFAVDTPFYSVGVYDQTIPFYLKRTVIPVKYAKELANGLASEPHLGIANVAEFRARWDKLPRAYAVVSLPTYRELVDDGWTAREVQRDAERVVLAKP